MPKVPTPWTTNSAIGTVDLYDTTGSYNGAGTTAAIDLYDGVLAGQSPITTKIPAAWSLPSKNATPWTTNTASQTGQRAYDSGSTLYNSGSLVYDGNTQSPITTKIATPWSAT